MAKEKPKKKGSVLYIDDEQDNLTAFKHAFRRHYYLHFATSGREAEKILQEENIHLVITDQRMPNMTGVDFLMKVMPKYPHIMRMILTGFSDIDVVIQAINKGQVYHYVNKPWDEYDLKITIDNALEAYHLRLKNDELIANLKDMNDSLEKKVIERTVEVESKQKEIKLLFDELNHRVKNNLQIVSSLLKMQVRQLNDEQAKAAVKEGQSRVEAMALMHQKLYQTDLFAHVNMSDYIHELASHLMSSYGCDNESTVVLEAEPLSVSMNVAVPLGLIINELMSNFFKHVITIKKEATLKVCIQKVGESKMTVLVQDNGVGLPEDFDIMTTKSFGLKLVYSLVKQLNAEINLYKEGGCCFELVDIHY